MESLGELTTLDGEGIPPSNISPLISGPKGFLNWYLHFLDQSYAPGVNASDAFGVNGALVIAEIVHLQLFQDTPPKQKS